MFTRLKYFFSNKKYLETEIKTDTDTINVNKKKIAIIIGLNYENTPNHLFGCINDTLIIKTLLTKNYNYNPKNIILCNDNGTTQIIPSKNNILKIFNTITNNITKFKTIFLYFSGHGGKNYLALINNELLFHYELKEYFIDKINTNINLIAVIDTCHSQDCFQLNYNFFNYNYYKYAFTKKNIKIIYSCLKNQQASEYYDYKTKTHYGLFTFYFQYILNECPDISWNLLIYYINSFMDKYKDSQYANLYFNKKKYHETVWF